MTWNTPENRLAAVIVQLRAHADLLLKAPAEVAGDAVAIAAELRLIADDAENALAEIRRRS